MSILKYKSTGDLSLTNAYYAYTNKNSYLSNNGAADTLEVFSIYNNSDEPQKSRILLNFPYDKIKKDRLNGIIPLSGNVKFYVNLYNVEHIETIPKLFYLSVFPVSSSWDEGYGLDLDNRTDIGQSASLGYGANWIFRTKTETPYEWNQPGGDFINNYNLTQYFESGLEDLSIDVTSIIEDQLSDLIPSNGLLIKLSGSYEDGSLNQNFFTKRFSARSSEYFYKTPSLEARWEALVKDDRGSLYFENINLSDEDNKQNIYFYNKVNGRLKNINNNPQIFVKIFNSNGQEIVNNITASNLSAGIYLATCKVPGSGEDTLIDVWYSGSNIYYSGSIEARSRVFDDSYIEKDYIFNITNLKKIYSSDEKITIKIFAREKNWSPNIYHISNNLINNLIFNNLYYKISRVIDNLTIIDYGIEPIAYTKCSYDKNGNYFDIDMSIFEKGYMYKIDLMLLQGETRSQCNNSFLFKVE